MPSERERNADQLSCKQSRNAGIVLGLRFLFEVISFERSEMIFGWKGVKGLKLVICMLKVACFIVCPVGDLFKKKKSAARRQKKILKRERSQ